jgi:hypothetical protein
VPKPPVSPTSKGSAATIDHWPEGRSVAFKVTDSLILRIPLAYDRFAILGSRAPVDKVVENTPVGFDFFLPDFSGYTPQNYAEEFNENKVQVVYLLAADPRQRDEGAPANKLKLLLENSFDSQHFEDMYALRCYHHRRLPSRVLCYGRRNSEDILFDTYLPPYPPDITFPLLYAKYLSKKYGGVEIAWRTHVRNLPRWHDIDAHIWNSIADWNVAPRSEKNPAPSP